MSQHQSSFLNSLPLSQLSLSYLISPAMSARRTPRVGGGKTNAPPTGNDTPGPATGGQLSARMEMLSARLSARGSARGSARPPRSGRPTTSAADGMGLSSGREQILSARSGAGNQVDDYINNQRSARGKTPGFGASPGSARGSARSRMYDMPSARGGERGSARGGSKTSPDKSVVSIGSMGDPADYLEKMRKTKMAEVSKYILIGGY